MKRFLIFLAFVGIANGVSAQTVVTAGPVDTSMKIEWDLPSNLTLTDAPTFEARLRDSTAPTSFTVLNGVNCVAGTPIVCTSQLTTELVTLINKVGKHDLTLTYYRSDVGESSQSLPFSLTVPTIAPTNLRITK